MEILKRELITENGCFKTERVWVKGWLSIPGSQHVQGWTGKETVLIRTYIVPIVVFEVKGELCAPDVANLLLA